MVGAQVGLFIGADDGWALAVGEIVIVGDNVGTGDNVGLPVPTAKTKSSTSSNDPPGQLPASPPNRNTTRTA